MRHILMSPWWSLCILYRWQLGSVVVGLFNVWRQLLERNYFPLFEELFVLCSTSNFLFFLTYSWKNVMFCKRAPRWCAVDAEVKVPPGGSPRLSNVPLSKPGICKNIALNAMPADYFRRPSFCLSGSFNFIFSQTSLTMNSEMYRKGWIRSLLV